MIPIHHRIFLTIPNVSMSNTTTTQQCEQLSLTSPVSILMIISYCLGIISIFYIAGVKIYKRMNPPSSKIIQNSSNIVQKALAPTPPVVIDEEPSQVVDNIDDVIQTMNSALQAITVMVRTVKN